MVFSDASFEDSVTDAAKIYLLLCLRGGKPVLERDLLKLFFFRFPTINNDDKSVHSSSNIGSRSRDDNVGVGGSGNANNNNSNNINNQNNDIITMLIMITI